MHLCSFFVELVPEMEPPAREIVQPVKESTMILESFAARSQKSGA
jgi:hypothetical protein